MRILALFFMIINVSFSSLSAIEGVYDVHGFRRSDGTNYTGVLVVEKANEVYLANWTLSDGSSTGTGVRQGDHVAFVFVGVNSEDSPITGVQLYKIKEDTLTRGPWTISGTITKGYEIAKKRNCE